MTVAELIKYLSEENQELEVCIYSYHTGQFHDIDRPYQSFCLKDGSPITKDNQMIPENRIICISFD